MAQELSIISLNIYDKESNISSINYKHIWQQKMDANFWFRDDLNFMGYLDTIDEFKQNKIPKLNQFLKMDFQK